ncbi:MAG: glutathione S-transferase [Richelia sp.]|nr:glutathione S-transferase [Richelia sp.]
MAFLGHFALALPPVADIPEEILRTQIITSARSPIDGKLLTAAEYAELQAKLRVAPPPKLNPKVRETIFLLRLRNLLMRVFPFIDI